MWFLIFISAFLISTACACIVTLFGGRMGLVDNPGNLYCVLPACLVFITALFFLYQVLSNEKGIPHWAVSNGYGGLQLVVGATIWLAGSKHIIYAVLTLTFFTTLFIITDLKVKKNHGIFCVIQ